MFNFSFDLRGVESWSEACAITGRPMPEQPLESNYLPADVVSAMEVFPILLSICPAPSIFLLFTVRPSSAQNCSKVFSESLMSAEYRRSRVRRHGLFASSESPFNLH